jgi:diguanylate cyclase
MYPAVAFAVVATLVWVVALSAAGRQYSHPAVWLINSLTQGIAFVLFAILASRVQAALGRERNLARYDALTGLPNRREFARLAERALGRCRHTNTAATLAYLDLDHFKQANDRFGHAHGDLLLGEIGRILQEGLRTQDVVGRLGGDEFAVCLPDTNAAQAREVLGRLRDRFNSTTIVADCGVTVSIGAVAAEHHDADLETWLQAADAAMYRAKTAGRDQLLVEPFPVSPPIQA